MTFQKKAAYLFIELFLFLLLFTGCSKNRRGVPADLSLIDNLLTSSQWAVIVSPYAAFHKEPDADSPVNSHGRTGDIYMVSGTSYVKETAQSGNKKASTFNSVIIWYCFEEGWISEKDLVICSNKLQAETYAKNLLEL